jgi:hypothetical protein
MPNLCDVLPPERVRELPGAELRVLVVLVLYCNSQGRSTASAPELGKLTGLYERSVRRALAGLERRGLLGRELRPGRSPVYQLTCGNSVKTFVPHSGPVEDTPVPQDRGISPTPVPQDRGTPVTQDTPPLSPMTGVGRSSVVVSVQTEQELVRVANEVRPWGVSRKIVEGWAAEYGLSRVRDALTCVRKAKRVRNPGGLLRRAVESGWRTRQKRRAEKLLVLAECESCGETVAVKDPEVKDGVIQGVPCRANNSPTGRNGQLFGRCGGALRLDRALT